MLETLAKSILLEGPHGFVRVTNDKIAIAAEMENHFQLYVECGHEHITVNIPKSEYNRKTLYLFRIEKAPTDEAML